MRGTGLIASYIAQWRELSRLRAGGSPDDASMEGLNMRLADINSQRRAVREGKPTSANGFGVADDAEVLARLDQEAREIQRAISARIRDDAYAAVFSGTPKEIDFTQGAPMPNKPARATEDLDKKTKARKELTEAEKAWLEFQKDMVALEGEWEDTRREYANAELDRLNAAEDAAESERQATADLIEAMQFELSLIGMSNVEREKAIALRLANVDAASAEGRQITDLVGRMQEAREAREWSDELTDSARNLFATIMTDSDRASSALDRFFDNLKRRLAEQLFEQLMAGFQGTQQAGAGAAGGGGKWWQQILAGMVMGAMGGGRAAGGPVMSGQAYVVGENGPEVFAPGQSGRVHPMGAAVSGGRSSVKLEVINNGPPVQATTQTTIAPDGTEIIKLVLSAVADDMANGGRTAQATGGRFGLRPAV